MQFTEALAIVLPRTFDAGSLVHDEDEEVAMADLGDVTPLDMGWAQVQAIMKYCAPISTFRPTSFESIGLPVEVVLRWRRGMLHAAFDFWRMSANGDCSLSAKERPAPKPAHKAAQLDKNGKFNHAVPPLASGSSNPEETNVIWWREPAWQHADASLAVPIQELRKACSTFNSKFVLAALGKGAEDQQVVGYLATGTNQQNDAKENFSFLPANSKSAMQNWYWLNKSLVEDLALGAATSFPVKKSPPTWPRIVSSSGAVPKDKNSMRRVNNLSFKNLKEEVKGPWLKSPNKTVDAEELPKSDYFRIARVGHHMLVMEFAGVRPKNAAYDFWRRYKQFLTQLSSWASTAECGRLCGAPVS